MSPDSERRHETHGGGIGRRRTDTVQIPAEVVIAAEAESLRIQRLIGAGFAGLGLIFAFAALQFFLSDPEQLSAISRELDDTGERIWNIAWGLGGALIVYGALRPAITAEVVGGFFVIAALVTYMVAVATTTGLAPAFYLAVVLIGFVGLRIYYLVAYAGRLMFLLRRRSS